MVACCGCVRLFVCFVLIVVCLAGCWLLRVMVVPVCCGVCSCVAAGFCCLVGCVDVVLRFFGFC